MTLSGHFDQQTAGLIKAAVSNDPKPHGAVSRWLVQAAKQRLDREGLRANDPRTALNAVIKEIGPERALQLIQAALPKI